MPKDPGKQNKYFEVRKYTIARGSTVQLFAKLQHIAYRTRPTDDFLSYAKQRPAT